MRRTVSSRAKEINALHDEIIGSLRSSFDKAIRIGRILTEMKAECAHGEWLPLLKENIKFSARSATRYMRLYEHRDELKSANVSDLTEAYALLVRVQQVGDEERIRITTNPELQHELGYFEPDEPELEFEDEPEPATSWTAPDVNGSGELESDSTEQDNQKDVSDENILSEPEPPELKPPEPRPEPRTVETQVEIIEPEWLEEAVEEHEEQSGPFKEVVIEEFERFLATFPEGKRNLVIETIVEHCFRRRTRNGLNLAA